MRDMETVQDGIMGGTVIIIGSGPAGLAAAVSVKRSGFRPLILERLGSPSQKLLASGGGRCNFSNILDPDDFMGRFGRNGAFMRDALRFAPRPFLLDFLKSQRVNAVLTDDFYYFPASGKARDISEAFLRASGAEVQTHAEAASILQTDGRVSGVMLADGERLAADAVILAAGGCAWSGLGSDAGLKLAADLGHTIRKPLPAVAPLLVREPWVGSLAGVTLPQAGLTLGSGRNRRHEAGSLLFTHEGLSGFPALNLAGEAASLCDLHGEAKLLLAVRTDIGEKRWQEIFEEARQHSGQRSVRSVLSEYIPRSLAEIMTSECSCGELKTARLPSEACRKLTGMLTDCPLTLTGAGPMGKAMAMRGGISLKEVNPADLSSKLVKGLYFAGEILDLDGPCGGYNMQWAFSSGFLAGHAAAENLKTDQGGK